MNDKGKQFAHLQQLVKIEEYGDTCNGHALHTWDAGHRALLKCPECNALVLLQSSEYHGSEDAYYKIISRSDPERRQWS